jgi:hypothetical protein
VTRLGEFSPIRQLLSFSCYLKITEVAQTFWTIFIPKKLHRIFYKKWFFSILGHFLQTHSVTLADSNQGSEFKI